MSTDTVDVVCIGLATRDTIAQVPEHPPADGRVVAMDLQRAGGGPAATGASGFLAGRAIWSDAIALDGLEADLQRISAPRLRGLGELVDEVARPWWDASG